MEGNMQRRSVVSLLFAVVILSAYQLIPPRDFAQGPSATARERVAKTADVLVQTYEQDTGLFRGTGWWNSANGITVLALAGRELHTKKFDAIFENTFRITQQKHPGFLNEFYDDEGWWALAWLDVYQLHPEPRYLDMSESIFADMSGGWSDVCGGGIWWKKDKHYKNAIANELFLSVASRLAAATSGETRDKYLQWAERESQWFLKSGMVNEQNLINDGLDASCHNNHQTTWSYNQGVILTGLSVLSGLDHEDEPRQMARRIALAAAAHLTDSQGVLHDPCEPKCGEDGIQFKGILVRNLAALEERSPSPEIAKLLNANAESVWEHARTADGYFSVDWAGPPAEGGTGSLISALDALVAEAGGKPFWRPR